MEAELEAPQKRAPLVLLFAALGALGLGWWFCCAAEIWQGSLISFPSAATGAVGSFVSLALQVNGRTESGVKTLKGIQKSK